MEELIERIKDSAMTFWLVANYANNSDNKPALQTAQRLADIIGQLIDEYMEETCADLEEELLVDYDFEQSRKIHLNKENNKNSNPDETAD